MIADVPWQFDQGERIFSIEPTPWIHEKDSSS